MNFNDIIPQVMNYIETNIAGAIAAGVILLFVLVKKPKLFLILIILCVVGIGFMQIFDKLDSSGISDKEFESLGELK
jgi:hypothetical protein